MTSDVSEVQACPFCGGKPASRWHGADVPGMEDCGYWGIDCCIAHAHADDEESAIRSWNTRAQPAVLAVPGWRPIESAPKDGTPIVIADIADGQVYDVVNGYFEVLQEDEDDGPWSLDGGTPNCSYVGRAEGVYFCSWLPRKELETRWRVTESFEYTHWMPLPATPAIHEGGEG